MPCPAEKGEIKNNKRIKIWEFYPSCDCRLSRVVDYGEDGNKADTLVENHIEPALYNTPEMIELFKNIKKY